MRYLIILLPILVLSACDHKKADMDKRLKDTLEILRRKADFKPLPEDEAYDFLNKYYLPRLDSLDIHRKIFIHPLNGKDFKRVFKTDSVELVAKYTIDTTNAHGPQYILEPPRVGMYSYNVNWHSNKFHNVTIATDSLDIAIRKDIATRKYHYGTLDRFKIFKKLFGSGYMIVSYPQYNQHTNKLFIEEWLEDGGWCGTGRGRKFWFKKVPGGWERY